MRTSLLNLRTIRFALAFVAATFAFLLAFAFFSDHLGGWPAGYVVSGVLALVAFVVALPIAGRYLSETAMPTPPLVKRFLAKEPKSTDDSARVVEETIVERDVSVGTGREGCWSYRVPIQIGDVLEGTLREVEGQEFSWMIVSKTTLTAFLNGEDIDYGTGEEDVRAAEIDWTGKKGRWYLVVDAYLKQYPRKVHVELRRVRKHS